MTNFRDSIVPPLSLVGDSLSSCFGQLEMEKAVAEIVRRCVEAGHWNVSLDRTMFVNVDPTNYTLDGFDELIQYGWLTKGYGDHWLVTEELVARLVKKRPQHFTEDQELDGNL